MYRQGRNSRYGSVLWIRLSMHNALHMVGSFTPDLLRRSMALASPLSHWNLAVPYGTVPYSALQCSAMPDSYVKKPSGLFRRTDAVPCECVDVR